MEWNEEIRQALLAPLPESDIEFLPKAHANGKSLGLPYMDARAVMNRLDAVVGPDNWSWSYDVLSNDGKSVRGHLTVLGVTKMDAGEANKEDEPLKSAVSDALKRCAVHFGIGRYLYSLPSTWAPYDPQKKRWIEVPRLDAVAVGRALKSCGYTGDMPGQAQQHRQQQAQPPRSGAQNPPAGQSAPEPSKSVWAAGTGPARGNASQAPPESSGDRRAAEAAARGETGGSFAGASGADEATCSRLRDRYTQVYPDGGAAGLLAWVSRSVGRGVKHLQELTPDDAAKCLRLLSPVEKPEEAAAPAPGAGTMACSQEGCGRPLTKGQHDMSVRAFGHPLCPPCQKQAMRAAC